MGGESGEWALYKAAEAAKMKREEFEKKVEEGEVEVSEDVQKAVQAASDEYWNEFDKYARAIIEDEDADVKAPSRNEHIVKAQKNLSEGVVSGGEVQAYWGKLHGDEMKKRGMDKMTQVERDSFKYDGVVPEGLKIPKQES